MIAEDGEDYGAVFDAFVEQCDKSFDDVLKDLIAEKLKKKAALASLDHLYERALEKTDPHKLYHERYQNNGCIAVNLAPKVTLTVDEVYIDYTAHEDWDNGNWMRFMRRDVAEKLIADEIKREEDASPTLAKIAAGAAPFDEQTVKKLAQSERDRIAKHVRAKVEEERGFLISLANTQDAIHACYEQAKAEIEALPDDTTATTQTELTLTKTKEAALYYLQEEKQLIEPYKVKEKTFYKLKRRATAPKTYKALMEVYNDADFARLIITQNIPAATGGLEKYLERLNTDKN